MHTQVHKKQKEKKQVNSKNAVENNDVVADEFFDQRPEVSKLYDIQNKADASVGVNKLMSFQEKANVNSIQSQPVQLKKFIEREGPNQRSSDLSQSKENKTGLPDDLKSGVESLSGLSMDDVKVHLNSTEPEKLGAHAYAQGGAIHVGPGQEQHLPHEAWHVVQQKQGRVKPTLQTPENVKVNDSESLEREATQMGEKAIKSSFSTDRTLVDAASNSNAPAQLLKKEEEISLKMGKPLDKHQRETVRNHMSVNEQIRGFDPSSLKKTQVEKPVSSPTAAPSTPEAVSVPSPAPTTAGPVGPTKAAVTRDTKQLENIRSIPGISSLVTDVANSKAEQEKHGDAGLLDKAGNAVKSKAARVGAEVSEGAKDAKAKGSGIWGSIKAGASSLWKKTKSFFGGGSKEEEKPAKANDPSTASRVLDTGANVVGHAGISAASSIAGATVGKVGDIGVNAVRAVVSGKDAYDAHGIMKDRAEDMKGKEGGDKDLGTALAEASRNQHIGQALTSGGKAVKGGYNLAESIATAGASDGIHGVVDSGLEYLAGAGEKAGKAAVGGGVQALMGAPKQKALSQREDLTLGETLAGQSTSETENQEKYKGIVDGKGELSEDQKKAAAGARSALFKEAADRSAGHSSLKEANMLRNKAESLDTGTVSEKYELEKQAIQQGKAANQHREDVDSGAHTLKPSDFKSRGADMRVVKALGDDLRSSDETFTNNLIANEGKSHDRMTLASEKIKELEEEARKGLNKRTGNRYNQ